jgi:hypothetical protein
MSGKRSHLLSVLALAGYNLFLYLPRLGAGFIHDDFIWMHQVAFQPSWFGFTHPIVLFYSPLTWLTFQLDWTLWGLRPLPYAAWSLVLHLANTLLLYWLALRLWGSRGAAWWTALGFALLFPANVWAVLWIATRGHLLAALFYLAALHAALYYARAENRRWRAGAAILAFAAAAMLSKENGVAALAGVAVVIGYERRARSQPLWRSYDLVLIVALVATLGAYLLARSASGAAPPAFGTSGYEYSASPAILLDNLWHYCRRTYLLLAALGLALAGSVRLAGARPPGKVFSGAGLLLSAALFLAPLAPVLLLRWRSGIYTYLPGLGAALLLGSGARVLDNLPGWPWQRPLRALTPIVLAVVLGATFTLGRSQRWVRMARTNTALLEQLQVQLPSPHPRTVIVVLYAEPDLRHRFPDGMASWAFPYAVRLLYSDPTLAGIVARKGEPVPPPGPTCIHFDYTGGDDGPRLVPSRGSLPAAAFP